MTPKKPPKPQPLTLRIRSDGMVWLCMGREAQECVLWADGVKPDTAERLALALGDAVTVEREVSHFERPDKVSASQSLRPTAAASDLFAELP